jgi:small subunit ribosomal protein S14
VAKKSSVEKNKRRKKLVLAYAKKRATLLELANDRTVSREEVFAARLKLAKIPRNASPTRLRSRCEVTGRPRAVYRKFKMSRIALREFGSQGLIPGLVKSSW